MVQYHYFVVMGSKWSLMAYEQGFPSNLKPWLGLARMDMSLVIIINTASTLWHKQFVKTHWIQKMCINCSICNNNIHYIMQMISNVRTNKIFITHKGWYDHLIFMRPGLIYEGLWARSLSNLVPWLDSAMMDMTCVIITNVTPCCHWSPQLWR